MNIHPIFVHFPIALLTLYSIMEILQFRVFRESRPWQIVKRVFVVLGAGSSYLAFQTGEMATRGFETNLIEMHSTWAGFAVVYFTIVGIIGLTRLINTEFPNLKDWLWNTRLIRKVWYIISKISDWICDRWGILVIIGVMGLIIISIVGALGGAIAYGPNADPLVSFIYHLWF